MSWSGLLYRHSVYGSLEMTYSMTSMKYLSKLIENLSLISLVLVHLCYLPQHCHYPRIIPNSSVVHGEIRGLLKMHEACNNSVEYLTNLNNIDVYQRPSGIYEDIYYSQTSSPPFIFKTTNPWKKDEDCKSLNVMVSLKHLVWFQTLYSN